MRSKFTVASLSILGLTVFSFSFIKLEVHISPGGPPAASAQETGRLAPVPQRAVEPPASTYTERIQVTNPVTVKRIRFERGASSSVITGSIGRVSEHDFLLGARGEQQMTVALSSDNATFCVYAPDGSQLTEISNSEWSGVLPQSGDYRVKVFGNGRNGQYTLEVSIQ